MTASSGSVAETVRAFASDFGDEAFEAAVERLTDDGREAVVDTFPDAFQDGDLEPEAALEQYWWGLYGQYGEFEAVGSVTVEETEAVEAKTVEDTAIVELHFANGSEVATVDVDGDGVDGFSFSPTDAVPKYVDCDAFVERDVTIDAGDVTLGGIVAVPDRDEPVPGVVLVHGHGIHDPDGTTGATTILRDLAWGLASEGIATLRYEKRLLEHDVPDETYTLDTVVTDDAVAAAETLAAAADVRADRVIVAGHSQGGMCAPRIADRWGEAAGAVLLDPPADPIVDPDDNLSWLRYSFEMDGELSPDQEDEFEALRETFRRIADADFDPDETIMGYPGAWHLSHHDIDPTATASDLDAPVYVAKASRADPEVQPELQASRRRHFARWDAVDLPTGSRTEFYEHVDHYFQDGPTPVGHTSRYFGGNVADEVVADIADWIHDVAGD